MERKPYRLGVTVGRFQIFHNGHRDMLERAMALCDRVGVFIGSSQEAGTVKNPLSFEERRTILDQVFGDRITVYPLPDIGVGNNARWGDYVLEQVIARFGEKPDLLVSGKESRRLSWFDSPAGLAVSELYVPKTIAISATQMRQFLLNGERERWESYTPAECWADFEWLRAAVLQAQTHPHTDSI